MRLRHIELFHAVLTTGSLTGAADLLNISQPAASKALQHAEQQLGFALFSRVRGRLQPTQQALLLRHRVEKIAQELHDLQRLTANIARPESYPLRVTCTPTLAQALVPDATTQLRKAFPGTTAELFTRHSAEMCESLMLHETDIGLTLQDASHQGLRQESLCRGQVMVIAPPGWWSPAELAQPLPVTALAGQPMIGIAMQDALGRMLQNHLAQVDPAPRTSIWVQTYQLAYSLVAQGEGLALVDPFTASRGGGEVVQTRPLKPQLDVVLYALYRQDSPLNPVQKHFLGLVRKLGQRVLSPC
ncbi:MAG: LysR substrate-binding domain-containing protein [Rhodanobacter sp.]|jgi:DNA-binding transcriptional LysR family regulator|uniref:LysR family transcriptional regulator n=1 Tax=Rhodanobacter sp. KK11 TaxID=3083255 RepID=UPI002965D46E|nr:LysR substrate-binding domain-containing protein [Rhodanobacter sp. KK11]MDW2980107.1 LysR substrate-binding domain-containing protein [Rhodanobacter sp. KK11]